MKDTQYRMFESFRDSVEPTGRTDIGAQFVEHLNQPPFFMWKTHLDN
jgi:hypothetical protein